MVKCLLNSLMGGVTLRLGVIRTYAVFLVFVQLKARTALARHPALAWSLSADVGTAVVLVHAVHPICSGDTETELRNCCLTSHQLYHGVRNFKSKYS